MFALEVSFKDGVSQPEVIFVRRPQALVGSSEYAHVVIDDMKSLDYQIRIVKELGKKFKVKPVALHPGGTVPALLDGVYEGSGVIDTGPVKIVITSLDIDLGLRENEPPDRAGVRVLRQACSRQPPQFPAVLIRGPDPTIVSFPPDQSIYIGRSNQCAVRLDSLEISSRHARLGFESGAFWIEDLGSTNGTYVNGQQISGRVNVNPGVPMVLGREISILGVTSNEELIGATRLESQQIERPSARRYPILVSTSEVARPARLVIPIGGTVSIGRDPASDLWLGAPHISRKHCEVTFLKSGLIEVRDVSTNGTAYDGAILKKGEVLEIQEAPRVFSFGGDLTVGLCFTEEHEESFLIGHGSPDVFNGGTGGGTVTGSTTGELAPFIDPDGGTEHGVTRTRSGLSDTISGDGMLGHYLERFGSLSIPARVMVLLVLVAAICVVGILAAMLWELALW